MYAEKRIEQLGLVLPSRGEIRKFEYARVARGMVYCSGNGPHSVEGPLYLGRVGADVTLEQAQRAARQCALNCLASIKAVVGDLDRIREITKVVGFVSCSPDFFEIPAVMDGCTDFLVEVFGPSGRHARSAIGTSNLPGNIPVEVELIALLDDAHESLGPAYD